MIFFLRTYALWASVAIPATVALAWLVYATAGRDPFRVAVYADLALSTLVLAVGHAVVISTFPDGRAPAWLVAFTYSKIAQVVTYSLVGYLVTERAYLGWSLLGSERTNEHAVYAAIGAMAAANTLAAAVFVAVLVMAGGFRVRIRPWPWQVVGDVIRKRKEG